MIVPSSEVFAAIDKMAGTTSKIPAARRDSMHELWTATERLAFLAKARCGDEAAASVELNLVSVLLVTYESFGLPEGNAFQPYMDQMAASAIAAAGSALSASGVMEEIEAVGDQEGASDE